MRLHFDLALVRRLLDHSKAAAEHGPTLDQLFDGRFRRDGRDVDLEHLGTDNFPTPADVDPTRIPAGLWLVGDQGIYLMSNGRPPLLVDPADTRNVVVYAAEADPAGSWDGWYETKRAAFGGDDGVVFLELAFAEGLLSRGRDGLVCLDLTPAQVEAVVPDRTQPAAARPDPSVRSYPREEDRQE